MACRCGGRGMRHDLSVGKLVIVQSGRSRHFLCCIVFLAPVVRSATDFFPGVPSLRSVTPGYYLLPFQGSLFSEVLTEDILHLCELSVLCVSTSTNPRGSLRKGREQRPNGRKRQS